MRIITGKYKGRHFDIPRTFKARPTTDFAKENIFNVLNGYIDFDGASALDLFSGTGSITLELLSRGCERVVSVELDRDHYRFIKECIKSLTPAPSPKGEGSGQFLQSDTQGVNLSTPLAFRNGAGGEAVRGDVFRFLKTCKQQFDFIFADPPYALKELPTLPDLIFARTGEGEEEKKGTVLAPDGVFVLEHGKDHDFSRHPHFVEHRHYGSVNFSIFR
jgi:16S rRNA (guanine(966)-N(2))-methyltransferase RsmD